MATENQIKRAQQILSYLPEKEVAEVMEKTGDNSEDIVFSIIAAKILSKEGESTMNSFFGIFDFHNVQFDAMDYHVVFDMVKVTKGLKFESCELVKGKEYQQVLFNFRDAKFSFINWVPDEKSNNPACNYIPGGDMVEIPQAELAKHLTWG